MSYTIIGSGISPYVRKVMVFMLEKGLAYESEDVSPFAPPEGFRELSPLGKIPAFRHDDRVVNDSSVICRYLEDLEPAPALYPADAYQRARACWLEEYVDGGVVPFAGPNIFFPLVLQPMMSGKPADEAGPRQAIEEGLPPFFDYLEATLGDAEFFVADALSIADISLASGLVNLRLAGVVPDAARWPGLAAFARRMHARPSFEAVIGPAKAAVGKRWVELD